MDDIPRLIIFIVIVLIVLVIGYILYSILVWHRKEKDPNYFDDPGCKFHISDIHTAYFTEEECRESGICSSTTPLTPVARPFFRENKRSSQYEYAADIAGAMELLNNEAIVMDVKIPSKLIVYCGITGYIYDIPHSGRRKVIYFPLGTVSATDYDKSGGTHMFAILTSNPIVASIIAKKYETKGTVRVITINENFCNPDFRFSLLGRVVHSKISTSGKTHFYGNNHSTVVKNPTFRTRKYVFPGTAEAHFPPVYNSLIDSPEPECQESTNESELNLTKEQWKGAAFEVVSKLQGVQIVSEVPVNYSGTHDFETLPGNLDVCEADNQDMTVFRSEEIHVKSDEIILVVYIDHGKSGLCHASTVAFFDSDRDYAYKNVTPPHSSSKTTNSIESPIKSYIHIPPTEVDTVSVKEIVFAKPRCHSNSIHQMRIFVLRRI
jgi:hypothetical protein